TFCLRGRCCVLTVSGGSMTGMKEIDVAEVTSVLLTDGWHEGDAETFTLGEYEFVFRPPEGREPVTWHESGASGICATGFQFREYQPEDGSVSSLIQSPASWIC